MQISDAKKIPLAVLVEYLGGRYSHTDRKGDMWYFSPFRPDERTASFKINTDKNMWHDFGLSTTFAHKSQSAGGDILDLWCDYHFKDRRTGITEALNGLAGLDGIAPVGRVSQRKEKLKPVDDPRFKIIRIDARITFSGLKDELIRRRISLELANKYLKQGFIEDTVTKKRYTCFLFENDKGGHEVSIPNPSRNECFKTCIGPKASTRLMGADDKNTADVFEGFWDMLAWLEIKGTRQHFNHTYVLNSVSLVDEVCEKITAFRETIKYVFSFMDNDEAGYQATHAIAVRLTDEDMQFGSFEQFYAGEKDLSEFWMTKTISKQLNI